MTEENKTEEVIEIMEHKTLVEALAYAMLEYEPLEKTEKVDFTTDKGRRIQYNYAGLPSTRRATDPALNKHGLVVTDKTEIRENREFLVSTLHHAHSDTIHVTELEISISSGDMKDLGGNITYARRYNYCNLTGRIAEEDNDVRDVERDEQQKQQPSDQQADNKATQSPTAKIAFFKLLTDEDVFEDDDARHKWQGIAFPKKPSTTKWVKSDFTKGKALILWRLESGVESDALLSYTTTKATSTKGLIKQFLAIYGVSKLTEVSDVSQWKIAMASAKLSIDHKMEAALDMGKVLMQTNQGLFDKFLEALEVNKLSTMAATQIETWPAFLKLAVDKYNAENEEQVDFDELVNLVNN